MVASSLILEWRVYSTLHALAFGSPVLYVTILWVIQYFSCRVSPLGLFFSFLIYFFIYSGVCWVFVSVRGPSPAAASGGHSSSRCAGLSPSRPLPLRSTGSRRAGSVIVAHGPSCSAARGIFPDQGPNPCPLHWQADSQPLRHQGSPLGSFLIHFCPLPMIDQFFHCASNPS